MRDRSVQRARAEPAGPLPALCLQRFRLSADAPRSWPRAVVPPGGRREVRAAAAQPRAGSLWALVRSWAYLGSQCQTRGTVLLLPPGPQPRPRALESGTPGMQPGGCSVPQDPLSAVCPSVPSWMGMGFHVLPLVGTAQASPGGDGGPVRPRGAHVPTGGLRRGDQGGRNAEGS